MPGVLLLHSPGLGEGLRGGGRGLCPPPPRQVLSAILLHRFMPAAPRLDRQLRIADWNQALLEQASVGVVGDDDWVASWYVLAAAALGLNRLVVLAPWLHPRLMEAARGLNPGLDLVWVQGRYTHPAIHSLLRDCRVIVDASHFGLATKLLLDQSLRDHRPLIRGFCPATDGETGLRVFTYLPGREWQVWASLVARPNLPGPHAADPVLAMIAAGAMLEETKNLLMDGPAALEVFAYQRPQLPPVTDPPAIAVVGAGALGNFVGFGLLATGFTRLTFFDADVIDITNLNRQVFFYDAVGRPKAETLAARLQTWFGVPLSYRSTLVGRDTDLSQFDIVFDCVDNFATRIVLSERCRDQGVMLVSGGSGVHAGQVVISGPDRQDPTPAEVLGLYDLVQSRPSEPVPPASASCQYRAEPAVIMTNQIIAGFMVDLCRRRLAGESPPNVFYDASQGIKLL